MSRSSTIRSPRVRTEPTASPAMFEFLTLHRRQVPSASFVFVLSDFIEPTPPETWEWALDRGWDIVPVIVQDPVWEQGFPDVDRLVVPLVGSDGRVRPVRLAAGESQAWRERHELRLSSFVDGPALARDRAGADRPRRPRAHLRGLPELVGRASGGMGARGVKRWAVIVLQVTAAVLVGLAVRELWLAVRGESDGSGSPSSAIAVTTSVTPTVVAFGTPVVATADVVADARIVRPDSIRLQTDFTPYEAAGEPTVERTVTGDTAHVVFRFPLRCLREGCDPAGARGVAQFEPGLVRYRFRDSPGAGRDIVDWPPVEVASRVRAADVEGIRWRASQTELSPVTTRFGPKGLAIVLLLGAGALVGGGRVARAPPLARPARARVGRARGRAAAPRARARARAAPRATAPRSRIGGVRSSGSHGSCRRSGSTKLADEARSLAWSPRVSTADEIESLARRAEDAVPPAVVAA